MYLLYFFFFKQKTAYEMRISDWSSDVCSSDLNNPLHHAWPMSTPAKNARPPRRNKPHPSPALHRPRPAPPDLHRTEDCTAAGGQPPESEIGRASCRERVCQYV